MNRSLLTLATLLSVVFNAAHADHPTLSLDEGSAGPMTTMSAVVLPEKSAGLSFQTQYLFSDELPDAQLKSYALQGDFVHSTGTVASYSLNGGYGLNERTMLGFSLPYVIRKDFREGVVTRVRQVQRESALPVPTPRHGGHGHTPAPAVGTATVADVVSYDIEGLSDATIFGQYRFFANEPEGLFLAVQAGLKVPTGKTDVRAPGGELVSTDHQPGSGSWDPMIGLSLSKHFGAWSFDTNALYTFSTEGARNTVVGDFFSYNAALSYRVRGGDFSGGAHKHIHHHPAAEAGLDHHHCEGHTTLDVFAELNGDYREAARIAGVADRNTGGNILFLSGGARLSMENGWAAAVSIGAPVLTDLNGIQSEPNLRVLFGVSRAF